MVIGIIVLLLMVIGVVWWRLTRRKRAMTVLLRHSQRVTDRVVTQALAQLNLEAPASSQAVADVWGHGVMAFSYHVPAPESISEETLNAALATVADDETIASSDISYPAFVVTDLWHRDNKLNFDVAFITNQATIDYVEDLSRLTE
ncbi:hypothetical protein [Lacticaseibacillus brantae]|uniref:Uncharacterized protein n=1 Tax=Lacticaseibacillus brantae DSM 23927 TaxID=1423727 RepID=A0A0R2AZH1_9LACO|nr:hypothetical protein [Lacticaseibacillus brantae]KRM72535.1 hypothetical protein FC34_GL000242 [Lacticaseibacillus brantae DSM 23927]